LNILNSWIVEVVANILWRLPENRDTGVAVWGETIIWGQSSGRILILQLKVKTSAKA
jgi:hypothetical protein